METKVLTVLSLTFLLFALRLSTAADNYHKDYDLSGVFEHCSSNGTVAPCVCMNTARAERYAADQRRRITQKSCLSCKSDCTASACSSKLKTCSSVTGCKRLCLCACPNVTATSGELLVIPCASWCGSRYLCAGVDCPPARTGFKSSTAGLAVGLAVIAVCVAGRFVRNMRRRQLTLRSPAQEVAAPSAAAADASPAVDNAVGAIELGAHVNEAPGPPPEDPPSQTQPGDRTLEISAQGDAPPDYETVMRDINKFRT